MIVLRSMKWRRQPRTLEAKFVVYTVEETPPIRQSRQRREAAVPFAVQTPSLPHGRRGWTVRVRQSGRVPGPGFGPAPVAARITGLYE